MKYYLGVDLGGTNIAAGVIDEQYNVVAQKSIPTKAGRSVEEIVKDIADLSAAVSQEVGLTMADFSSWGIGTPSYVDPKTHLLVHVNNLGWKNVPIFDYLNKYTDIPIYIENDANCAALGEALAGAAQGHKNAIMLTLGTGVGGGIILNNRVYSGADMLGTELGHTKLVFDGEQCNCGQRGCMESYCSATALIRHAKEAIVKYPNSLIWKLCKGNQDNISAKTVFDAQAQGDICATHLVEQYIEYLSGGLSTFVTIFRPEIVIIGGGVAQAGQVLLEPLQKALYKNTFAATEIGVPPIVKAKLGNEAGIIGAAFLEKYADRR